MKYRVLFLCTGNSARSQMAEGILRHLAGDRFAPESAGTDPVGLNPRAVDAMEEIGIDIAHHRSKHLQEYLDQHFDLVITVCDRAKESCPVFPHARSVLHWSFEDPAAVSGSEQQKRQAFQKIRDEIVTRVKQFILHLT
jgi:arsenate reductase